MRNEPVTGFSVVLGPDYAGKSTLISALAARGVRCVSYDPGFVRPECSLVDDLRDGFVTRAMPGVDTAYSRDFVLTLLQTSVVYLRDQALDTGRGGPVVVDSYYYKILAKCRLTGLVNDRMFAWWRSFPEPSRVIYLDVDPATAWRRSDNGARLNAFEHYGAVPTWEGFRRFQIDLRRLMVEEIGTVPIHPVDGPDSIERTVAALRHTPRSGHAGRVDR
ncbi:hypothetical protein GCM10009557_32370 [Virgisporangium ochraceum]|uniref:Thymidylate kinase n=1 Tax=Virgisporangium ochraceum TaxID=65505 RepID=A0A8J3ZUL8_9ACTN|nr:hypothetical protein [Virgisporangium ochraceum]GIJ70744.1 hypothetical protein Voc01_056610 [Virgisporangium ochraceum]